MKWSFSLAICLSGLFYSTLVDAEEEAQPEEAQPEEEVMVYALRSPRVTAEPELASTVIDGDALREPGADVGDILARSPGLQVNRAGTSAELTTVSMRGASAAQVPIYIAGIRINDDVLGIGDLSRIPLWMIQRVEVYRSAVPLHLPRSGVSGALLFEPTLPRKDEFRIGAMVGSFESGSVWMGGSMAYGGQGDGATGATSVSLRRRGSQNDYLYSDDAGTAFQSDDDEERQRVNADFSESDLWLVSRGRIPLPSGDVGLTFLLSHLTREQGVSGLSLIPAESARSDLEQGLLGLSARLPCSWGHGTCSFLLATSALSTELLTDDPMQELSLGSDFVDQEGLRVSHRLLFTVQPASELELGLSAVLESSQLGLNSEQGPVTRSRESFFGGVTSLAYSPREDLLIRAVGRASCVDSIGSDSGRGAGGAALEGAKECLPEGRLGASLDLSPELGIRSTVVRGLRFPTLGERFGVSAATRGNPALRVEKAWSSDIGLRLNTNRPSWGELWLDASVYGRLTEDLVAYRRSALGYVRPFNVGMARFLGIELSGEVNALSHLRLRSNLSLLDPRNITKGSEGASLIPYRSQVTSATEFELYANRSQEWVSRWGLSTYFTYRSARVADPAGLLVLPGAFIVDFSLRAQVRERLELKGRVENVFSTTRFDLLGFPLPGAAFHLSMEMHL